MQSYDQEKADFIREAMLIFFKAHPKIPENQAAHQQTAMQARMAAESLWSQYIEAIREHRELAPAPDAFAADARPL